MRRNNRTHRIFFDPATQLFLRSAKRPPMHDSNARFEILLAATSCSRQTATFPAIGVCETTLMWKARRPLPTDSFCLAHFHHKLHSSARPASFPNHEDYETAAPKIVAIPFQAIAP